MDTVPHAHRRPRIHTDRLNKLCDLVANNPGIHKRDLYYLYYESTERKADRINSLASMMQTLCHEHRVMHKDHYYYIWEPQND
jgi:hypothetical protein